jgi:acyl-CoA synthetase (AMP-forming)/AMP-acid ligase II
MSALEPSTAPGGYPMREQTINGTLVRAYDCGPWNLREVLEGSRAHGDRDYLVFDDERYTFAGHHEIVAGLAEYLAREFGIGKGDRMAIAMRNLPEFAFHFWATIALGAVAVPLNAWWTADEAQFAFADCQASLVILDGERLERWAEVLPRGERLISVRSDREIGGAVPFDEIRRGLRPGAALPDVPIEPEDLATILYTSGTTGRSNGVPQTHRNHCTNLINTRVAGSAGYTGLPGGAQTGPQGGIAAHLPLFHIAAMAGLYLSALAGTKIVLMRKWDTERALELIERERLTSFSGVPMQAQAIFDSPSFRTRDLSSLTSFGFAGTATAPAMVRRVHEEFGGRVAARTGYGMTEATSAVTFITGEDYQEHPDSVGRPLPVNDLRIVDNHGADVPPGGTGEVWVRGPNVVSGYWNRPEATAAAFLNGWHRSGDVGRLDAEGRLHIVDRIKDVVIRAGENVYTGEVEAVLARHPAVLAAVVLGLPHERLGEEVAAVVRLRHPTTEQELREHVAAELAHFKVPSRWVFTDEDVPRTATGKVLKRAVRDKLTEEAL